MRDRITKIKGHVDHLVDAMLGLLQRAAIFKPLVSDPAVRQSRGSGARASGFQVISHALYTNGALDVAKLAFDRDPRTPSVANIMEAIRDPAIRKALRAEYSEWKLPPGDHDDEIADRIAEIEKQRQDGLAAEFDATLDRVLARWEAFQSTSWASGFKTLRDKVTAHLELRLTPEGYKPLDVSTLGLKWGDLALAVDQLVEIVLDLHLLVNRAGFEVNGARTQFDAAAGEFWA